MSLLTATERNELKKLQRAAAARTIKPTQIPRLEHLQRKSRGEIT